MPSRRRISDHRYDSGPTNTHALCIAIRPGGKVCDGPEEAHFYSEYQPKPFPNPPRDGRGFILPGDQHEPPSYPASSLEWPDDAVLD